MRENRGTLLMHFAIFIVFLYFFSRPKHLNEVNVYIINEIILQAKAKNLHVVNILAVRICSILQRSKVKSYMSSDTYQLHQVRLNWACIFSCVLLQHCLTWAFRTRKILKCFVSPASLGSHRQHLLPTCIDFIFFFRFHGLLTYWVPWNDQCKR